MPPFNCQSSKTLQLGTLWVIRATAVSAYKSLVDDEKRLRYIFPQHNGSRGSIFWNKTNIHEQVSYDHEPRAATPAATAQLDNPILYIGKSLAEKTIECYGPPQGDKPKKISLWTRDYGRSYLYNLSDPDFSSYYNVGLRGYFKCGQNPGHSFCSKCPLVNTKDRDMVRCFYKELYIHKSHLKVQPEYKQ